MFTQGMNDKRWIVVNNENSLHMDDEYKKKYTTAFQKILTGRGFTSENLEYYLEPSLDKLHLPNLLDDMQKAVNRLHEAMAKQEAIWIYGDYDVDGITSVSLLMRAFKQLEYPVTFYIPDRHEEGYGLNASAFEKIAEQGGQVVITVDCGITSVSEALVAKNLGIDLIITDHHECQEQIPDAYAVINPKKSTCQYPYKMLAGVGIAYKLACELLKECLLPIQEELLELAAFGTIADIAPLDGENRILAKHGLESLSNSKIKGFKALIECSDLSGKKITAGHVGFMLAPKINAAGRIDDPKQGVVLLTTEDEILAASIASELKETNDRRQELEKAILEEAIAQIDGNEENQAHRITIAYGEHWNSGVIGIVASRLVERYHKPALVFSLTDGKAKGSARSIEGFDIFEGLIQFKHLYEKFGGHEQAAGLTLLEENFEIWKNEMYAYADEMIPDYLLVPALKVEHTLLASDVTYEFANELLLLEPYGMGNPKPIFKIESVSIQKKVLLGKNKEFTKFELSDGIRTFDAISFDKSGYYQLYKVNDEVDILCNMEINEFRGTQTIQLHLKDIRGYREELCRQSQPFSQLKRAYAERLVKEAQLLYTSNGDGYGRAEQLLAKLNATQATVYGVSSEQGLFYFFNRYFDEKMRQFQLFLNEIPAHYTPAKNACLLVLHPSSEFLKALGSEVHMVENDFDLPLNMEIDKGVQHFIPDREALIDFYKQVRGEKFAQKLPENLTEWLSAKILSEAMLVKIQSEGMSLLPAPEVKVDLMEVDVYKSLQLFKQVLKSR